MNRGGKPWPGHTTLSSSELPCIIIPVQPHCICLVTCVHLYAQGAWADLGLPACANMAPAQAMSCTGRLIGSKRCPLAAAAAPRRRCHLKARGVVTIGASRSSVSNGTGLHHKPALQALQSAAATAAAALAALGLCAAQALAQDASPAAADAALSAEPGVRAVQEVLLDVWKEVDERFIDAATAPVDWRQAQQVPSPASLHRPHVSAKQHAAGCLA